MLLLSALSSRPQQIDQLDSVVDFPNELSNFESILQRVSEFYAQRLKLSAEMADSSNVVKTLVVRAEDSRLLNDMKLMIQMYSNLMDTNRELLAESTKRANNNAEVCTAYSTAPPQHHHQHQHQHQHRILTFTL